MSDFSVMFFSTDSFRLLHFGIRTFVKFILSADSIFSGIPPTGPIRPPELIVPVIVTFLSRGILSSTDIVSTEIAAPALGPPTIAAFALMV